MLLLCCVIDLRNYYDSSVQSETGRRGDRRLRSHSGPPDGSGIRRGRIFDQNDLDWCSRAVLISEDMQLLTQIANSAEILQDQEDWEL